MNSTLDELVKLQEVNKEMLDALLCVSIALYEGGKANRESALAKKVNAAINKARQGTQ